MNPIPVNDDRSNISYSLIEPKRESSCVTYDELLREVDLLEMTSIPNMDDYMANEINYSTNYTRKELNRIADYYEISKHQSR